MRAFLLFFIVMTNVMRADALPEYTLKAAYLYNFALLTDWPSGKKPEDFNLCFFREDLGSASDALQNKMLHNQKFRVSTIASPEEAKGCQMVYIRESEEQMGERVIKKLSGSSVLVVSENPNIANAHITVLREKRKLAFDVSLGGLRNADLSVSSRLLKLARKVNP